MSTLSTESNEFTKMLLKAKFLTHDANVCERKLLKEKLSKGVDVDLVVTACYVQQKPGIWEKLNFLTFRNRKSDVKKKKKMGGDWKIGKLDWKIGKLTKLFYSKL